MYPENDNQGFGAFVRAQELSLRRQNIQIDVLVIQGKKGISAYFKGILELHRRLRREKYDLVHAHYGTTGLVARCQFSCPVLVSFCGTDINSVSTGPWRRRIFYHCMAFLHRQLSRIIDYSIVKSEEMKKKIPSRRVVVIPNGINMEKFVPLDRGHCREQLNLPADRPMILFPYPANRPGKGYEILEKSLQLIPGQEIGILEVHGVPHDQMPLYYNSAQLMVLPSSAEGSPNSVKEAMACNLPVIATDVGDIRERLSGVGGCFIVRKDPVEIAARIQDILNGPGNYNIRESVTPLSEDRIAQRIVKLYHWILKRRSSAPD